MATSKSNAQRACRPQRPRRSAAIEINLATETLTRLMVEQFRDDSGYVTIYSATRDELIAAGVPEAAFPMPGVEDSQFTFHTLNACSTGSKERLNGSIHAIAQGHELVIRWGGVMPYMHASHPALCELARALSLEIRGWCDADLRALVSADPETVEWYKPRDTPRPKLTPEFIERLNGLASEAHRLVFEFGEILPESLDNAQRPAKTALRLVVDNA